MKKCFYSIVVILLMTNVVWSQADIGLKGVGGKVGYIMPEDPIDDTFGFGLEADLGTIMPNLSLHGFLEYWSKSYDFNLGYGAKSETTFSLFGIGADARYHFEMDSNIKPFAGGGIGFNIGRASSEYVNPVTGQKVDDSSSDTDIAIHLLGGASMELSSQMDGFAQIKYVISDAEYFGIFAGVIYKLKMK